jgi:pilus assembly protein Flp/PilA
LVTYRSTAFHFPHAPAGNTFPPLTAIGFLKNGKKLAARLQITADVRVAMTPDTLEEREMGSITRFIKQDAGADLIEYALLAGLISLAAVGTLSAVGTSINGLFTKISGKLDGVSVP